MMVSRVNWVGTFLIGYQLLLLALLPLYLTGAQHLGLWVALPVLVVLCGIGVTSLYHRYYSHRAYQMHPAAETVLLFFGTIATQGSALEWSHDHRLHHRFVDTDKDPYSIKKGFWHAHFLWMFKKRDFDERVVHDLAKNRLLAFQHKHYVPLLIALNAAVVALFGWLFNDYLGAFVVLFLLRLFINHHTTWFINSAAHTWGARPYSREHSAVNNWFLSLLTYGEGYHNYHHTFASDYRNGTRWYHFDPTKLMIWTMSKLGLARGLHRIDQTLAMRKLLLEDQRLLLERTDDPEVAQEINTRALALSEKLLELRTLIHAWSESRQRKAAEARELKAKSKTLKRSVRVELRSWGRFCDHVLRRQRRTNASY